MNRIAKSLGRLARSWWQIDQVRASPEEGRLLRLQPPCYIRIGAETLEIYQRRPSEQGLGVIYQCSDGSQLWVDLRSLNNTVAVYWQRDSGLIELAKQEIEIFGS